MGRSCHLLFIDTLDAQVEHDGVFILVVRPLFELLLVTTFNRCVPVAVGVRARVRL